MTVDIQIQPMSIPVADLHAYDTVPSYITGMEVPEPNDPAFRWSVLTAEGIIEVLIRNLCERAAADPSDVEKISLVVPTLKRDAGPNTRPTQPALMECGGTTFVRPFVGDRKIGRAHV